MKRFALFAALAALTAPAVLADFSYEQTSKMTGGAMMSMMKIAGAFSKQLREPMRSSVYVKGDRMATITGTTSAQIIDLSKETITAVDFQKKTYSVITFAQMTEALKQLEAKLNEKKDPNQPEMSFKASLKETGQTKDIQGMSAREVVLTIDMEGTDEKGQKGGMRVTADMWMAPKMAGYDEVRSFHERMASKLNWAPGGGGMFTQGRSDIAKAFAGVYKESAKLDGIPVLQITVMGGTGEAAQAGAGQSRPEPQPQAEPQEKPSVGGALGRLGGRFGGLGGLGRKKKDDQPPAQAQPAPQSASSAPAGSASLMELTTELSSFSAAPVDGSKFEVPAGFKQVESEQLKQMRK